MWEELDRRIAESRKGGRRDVAYRKPTATEQNAYFAWIGGRGADPPPAGFARASLGSLVVLHERDDARRGAGVVVLNGGSASSIVVEAPHTFFDGHTLPIALAVFRECRARALLVNTVHRFSEARERDDDDDDDEGSAHSESDVAHAPESFFTEAHKALAGSPSVQIHGFADAKSQGHAAIVSAAGTSFDVTPVVRALTPILALYGAVAAYPTDVRILGGTTNVQAGSSRTAGLGFVHIEISRSAREALANDSALRQRFGRAIAEGLGATRQ